MAPRVVNSPRDPAHSHNPPRRQTVDTLSIREKAPEVRGESTQKCAGCRDSFRKQDLITVHEGHHDDLHFFNGDRICKSCARANGVEF
jgi:hypothetical protein